MTTIDLNCDLGEHPGESLDEAIMPFLSSCNIACGGHAGNEDSVRASILLAQQHGVAIGAHPGFPDKVNFGRLVPKISTQELRTSLTNQVNLVKRECDKLGASLHHVKPHGALYNLAAKEPSISALICEFIAQIDPTLKLYGLADSVTETVAKGSGVAFIAEGFADRKYESDKSLRSRSKTGAVLSNETDVLQQVEELVLNERVFSDQWIALNVKTICLHSDTQGAVNLAKKIRAHLEKNGIRIAVV